mgnify:CR=1 FL=1
MLVYAHLEHRYEERASHTVYVLPAGTWRDMPDGVGQLLVEAHPDKLCDVSPEQDPDRHVCSLSRRYAHTAMTAPPAHSQALPSQLPRQPGMARLSAQKAAQHKKAARRSRIARMIERENDGPRA